MNPLDPASIPGESIISAAFRKKPICCPSLMAIGRRWVAH